MLMKWSMGRERGQWIKYDSKESDGTFFKSGATTERTVRIVTGTGQGTGTDGSWMPWWSLWEAEAEAESEEKGLSNGSHVTWLWKSRDQCPLSLSLSLIRPLLSSSSVVHSPSFRSLPSSLPSLSYHPLPLPPDAPVDLPPGRLFPAGRRPASPAPPSQGQGPRLTRPSNALHHRLPCPRLSFVLPFLPSFIPSFPPPL